MSKKKTKRNTYAKKAKQKGFLAGMNEEIPTKGNVKNTMLETGKGILITVIGGGLIGAAIGKPSFLAGLVTTGLGHYTQNKLVSMLGIGMMASNGFGGNKGVSGLEGLDGVKERMVAFKEDLMDKTYLNKVIKPKAAAGKTVGELQYFNYNNEFSGAHQALASIENQLLESGMQYHQANGDQFAALEEEEDWEERLY